MLATALSPAPCIVPNNQENPRMGRRRKGRYGAIPAQLTKAGRSLSLTTLLSQSVIFVIIITVVAPTMLSHRRQLHNIVSFLVHREDALAQSRQTRQKLGGSNQKETTILRTSTHFLKAVNASSLTPRFETYLKAFKKSAKAPSNDINKNVSKFVQVNEESRSFSAKSQQQAIVRKPDDNKRTATYRPKGRHSRARIRRKIWWSLLHRRIYSKSPKTHDKFRSGTGRYEESKVISPPPLGRRNVIRDHVGRIVESESDTSSGSAVGHRERTERASGYNVTDDPGYKSSTWKPPVTEDQRNDTESDGKEGEEDEEGQEEENEDEKDSTNTTGSSGRKSRAANRDEFKGSMGGTTDGMVRGQNVTKLSATLFKIMKLFGFSSLTDSPAGAHAEWMGDVARRLSFEQPLFRYIGVDETSDSLRKAKESIGDDVDGEFEIHDVERELGNSTDVLFHWTELDGSPRDAHHPGYLMHVRRVLQTARRAGHGNVIFPQLPRLQGVTPSYRHGKWTFIDRKDEEPFLFNEHLKGAVPVGNGSRADVVYLTFYSSRAIPAAQLEV